MINKTGNKNIFTLALFCLAMFWCEVAFEVTNLIGPDGSGPLVAQMFFVGLVAWTLLETFFPRFTLRAGRWLIAVGAASTVLLGLCLDQGFEGTEFAIVRIMLGLSAGGVFSHLISRFLHVFPENLRTQYIAVGLGFFFSALGFYVPFSEFIFNNWQDKIMPIYFGVLTSLPAIVFFLYPRIPKTKIQSSAKQPPLPARKWMLVPILAGLLVLTVFSESISLTFLATQDMGNLDLMAIWYTMRMVRLPLIIFYGILLGRRKWRIAATLPILLMITGAMLSLISTGDLARALIYSLFNLGGISCVFFVHILPIMLAPHSRRTPLIANIGAISYMLLIVVFNINLRAHNIAEILIERRELLFAAVVFACIPMFLLLTEYFLRQRSVELEMQFAQNAKNGSIEPAPKEDSIQVQLNPESVQSSGAKTYDIDELSKQYALTRRERELLPYLLTPLTNEEIAKETYISINTVRTHIRNTLSKMQVTSRRELQKMLSQNSFLSQ